MHSAVGSIPLLESLVTRAKNKGFWRNAYVVYSLEYRIELKLFVVYSILHNYNYVFVTVAQVSGSFL